MKRLRLDSVLLLLLAVCIAFSLGYFVASRHSDDELRVSTSNEPVSQTLRMTGGDTVKETAAPTETATAASTETEAPTEIEAPTETVRTLPVGITADGKVNLNTADLAALCTLPGIGETLGQRIIDYREANGAFTVLEELYEITGLGEKRIEAIREYVTMEDT